MAFGFAEVFLGIAIAIYIYMIVDRICKCFETCNNYKMFSGMYSKMDPLIFKQLTENLKEK